MQIGLNTVVAFHYSVAEVGQAVLQGSIGGPPMLALVGHRNLVPGLERALLGKAAGEQLKLRLEPQDAYGERREHLKQRVSRKLVRPDGPLKPGDHVVVRAAEGSMNGQVIKAGLTVVDVDLNHPLAGKTLDFAIDIVAVRAATADELAHGHAHGEGSGHHH